MASTSCTRSNIATTKQKIIIPKIRKPLPLKSSYMYLMVMSAGFRLGPEVIKLFSHQDNMSEAVLKPLSHWDATSSRWVCESIRQTIANCRETFAWYRKVLACIANSSRTGRQSFKHVILFCATKFIAKPSPSHRICREPVADPSPTLRIRSQTHRKEVSAI